MEGWVEEEELDAAAAVISLFLTRQDPKEPAGWRRDAQWMSRSLFCFFNSDYFIIVIQPLFIISACAYSCTAAGVLSKDVPGANTVSAVCRIGTLSMQFAVHNREVKPK